MIQIERELVWKKRGKNQCIKKYRIERWKLSMKDDL